MAEASAAPEHVYKIELFNLIGAKEITAKIKPGTEFIMEGEQEILKAKVKSEIKCKKLGLNAAAKPVVVGPGSSEKEKFEFAEKECTATLGTDKCEKVKIESAQVNNELVTIIKPAAKAGKLGNWFVPETGELFFTVKFTKCGIFGTREAKVEGSTAALVNPEKVEAVAQTWVWSKTEEITEIERQNKERFTTGLKFAGFPWKMQGEIEVELVSKELWGGF